MLGNTAISEAPIASITSGDAVPRISGIPANTTLGTVTPAAGALAITTGQAATSSLGSVSIQIDYRDFPDGFGTVASLGTAIGKADVVVSETGFGLTLAQGSVSVQIDYTDKPTGFAITSALDQVVAPAAALPSTVVGTGTAGSPTISAGALVAVTGEGVTAQFNGNVGVEIDAQFTVDNTNLFASSEVGNPIIKGGAVVEVTGVEGTGEIDPTTVWGRIVPNPGTVWSNV